MERESRGPWAAARKLALQTPEARNRYVDLLRAVSISAVVVGHWLIAAPVARDGQLALGHMLDLAPWTRWLTWLFQVMPIFFIVGGYSNSASLEAARRSQQTYGAWLVARLRRLVGPVLPLLAVWAVFAALARQFGVAPEMIRIGSQAALVPIWFLAVYVLVAVLAPVTHASWRRFGVGSLWMLAAAAVVVDLARFGAGWVALGWVNYLFVWLAVHQLGYLWRDGRLAGPRNALPWAVGGLVLLVGLVKLGPYPVSMVGVPGDEVSNTLPPSLAMLALGALQGGLLLSVEGPLRRWLARTTPWTATVLVNSMIMSVYLWHLTAMVLVIGLAHLLGDSGLHLVPGSSPWWATRPIWMLILVLALLPLLVIFGRYERPRASDREATFPAWRGAVGAAFFCAALALLALHGMGSDEPLGIRWSALVPAFLGATIIRIRRSPRSA